MREDLTKDLLPTHGEAIDPVAMARRDQKKSLPKRFYKEAAAEWREGAFALCLDGRIARTPGRNALAVPTREAGEALAREWAAQGEFIDPATMPLTRIVNSALDGVIREIEGVRAEIVKYAGSDLLCYRADDPETLVAMQKAKWDPPLDWARRELGAELRLASGIAFVEQSPEAIAAIARAVEKARVPLPLAALHVMTTLTGSCVLALAVARGFLSAEAAWEAANVDEDFEMRTWGRDEEAMARDRKSTRLNSSHIPLSRMPSSA